MSNPLSILQSAGSMMGGKSGDSGSEVTEVANPGQGFVVNENDYTEQLAANNASVQSELSETLGDLEQLSAMDFTEMETKLAEADMSPVEADQANTMQLARARELPGGGEVSDGSQNHLLNGGRGDMGYTANESMPSPDEMFTQDQVSGLTESQVTPGYQKQLSNPTDGMPSANQVDPNSQPVTNYGTGGELSVGGEAPKLGVLEQAATSNQAQQTQAPPTQYRSQVRANSQPTSGFDKYKQMLGGGSGGSTNMWKAIGSIASAMKGSDTDNGVALNQDKYNNRSTTSSTNYAKNVRKRRYPGQLEADGTVLAANTAVPTTTGVLRAAAVPTVRNV